MTLVEKQALFDAVEKEMTTHHHRECFVDDNFAEFDIPCNNVTEFTQWFFDNNMSGSLMAHMNSDYGYDLTLTYNLD
jgi:hypothetical protein